MLKLKIIAYVAQYKQFTSQEQGTPGFWYYSFIVSMNAAWIFTVLGLLSR